MKNKANAYWRKINEMRFLIRHLHILNPNLKELFKDDYQTARALLHWGHKTRDHFNMLSKIYHNTIINLSTLGEALDIRNQKVVMEVDHDAKTLKFWRVEKFNGSKNIKDWTKTFIHPKTIKPLTYMSEYRMNNNPKMIKLRFYQEAAEDPGIPEDLKTKMREFISIESFQNKITNAVTDFWSKCQEKCNLIFDDSEGITKSSGKVAINTGKLKNLLQKVIDYVNKAMVSAGARETEYKESLMTFKSQLKEIGKNLEDGFMRYSISTMQNILNEKSIQIVNAMNDHTQRIRGLDEQLYRDNKIINEKIETIAKHNWERYRNPYYHSILTAKVKMNKNNG